MKKVCLTLVFFLVAGCAGLKAFPFTEDTKKYQAAKTSLEQGNYQAARDAFRAISETRSPWAEESQFHAAYLLVMHANPQKSYTSAEREFEAFLDRYPKSALAGEAATWLAMLKMFHQTKAGELAQEIESLIARSASITKELQKTLAEDDLLRKEREALLSERTALLRKADNLLNEKEALIRKNMELVKDNEGLAKDKTALTRKVAMLKKEKQKLAEARAALEKSLRELTMVDIKMERKRAKIKKSGEKK